MKANILEAAGFQEAAEREITEIMRENPSMSNFTSRLYWHSLKVIHGYLLKTKTFYALPCSIWSFFM